MFLFESYNFCFILAIILFFIAIFAFLFNGGNNLLMLIIALEIILFAIGLLLVQLSFQIDDLIGATFTLYLLPLAGAESAIALALFIAFYPIRGSIKLNLLLSFEVLRTSQPSYFIRP